MERIFLIGYMGSGKTTLGRAYATAEQLDFIDLDWYIEGRYHLSVRELFNRSGEEAFRRIERNLLHEVGEFENVIIACGGGTPCFFDNMEYMNASGKTVFLNPSEEALFRRLKAGREKRPLLAGKSDEELRTTIAEALRNRLPYYTQAKFTFDSGWLENRRQIGRSVEHLKKLITVTE